MFAGGGTGTMNQAARILIFCALLTLSINQTRAADEVDPALESYQTKIVPLLEKYCYQCHGNGAHKADLTLDSYKTLDSIRKDHARWELLQRFVRTSEMPPPEGREMPTQEERDQIVAWISNDLFKTNQAKPDPGRVTIHRLNRAEYSNTIRDLLGIQYQASEDFPPDDSGYGFDNIGDVLSLPPVLLEKYLAVADRIMDEAIPTDPIESKTKRFPASLSEIGFNALGDRGDGWVQLISLEEDDVAITVPATPGEYLVRVFAFAKQTGGAFVGGGNNSRVATSGPVDSTKIGVMVDNAFVQDFELTTDESKPQWYEARISLPQGRHRVRAVIRRIRGGENELIMLNGRIGKQQPGIGFVKYIELQGPLPVATTRKSADALLATGEGVNLPDGARRLDKNGDVTMTYHADKEGDFTLRTQAYADQAGTEPVKMELRVDGTTVRSFDVVAPGTLKPIARQRSFSSTLLVPVPYVYETKVHLTPGNRKISVAFTNDFEDPQNENVNLRNRNLYVDYLEVANPSAPAVQPDKPAMVSEMLALGAGNSDPRVAAKKILQQFVHRAWRRPVTDDEIDRLVALFDLAIKNGETFDAAIKLPMKATLVSPHFLFRGEAQTPAQRVADIHPVSEIDLASRLSYFLWSSMPDEELLSLAERGELRKNLAAQVQRMLASPKSRALVDNFAAQWLQTRGLDTVAPDKDMFPAFDAGLRYAMQQETQLFFDHIMRDDRNVMEFITADYTFVNERLAQLYGIQNVTGEEFRQVSLEGLPRRGVLTQGSVLTLTSNPSRTSPVKRGKFVLDNLLGTPPPEPPPNVPALDDEKRKLTGTLRQQMEQHRADPNCASCHARMDPIGFALENFDAIGTWREKEGESSIDPSGKLLSGESFNGAVELSKILATGKRADFLHCLARKMLTYALGRGTENYDEPAVDLIVQRLEKSDDRFSALIMGVVDSLPFENRRGDSLTAGAN